MLNIKDKLYYKFLISTSIFLISLLSLPILYYFNLNEIFVFYLGSIFASMYYIVRRYDSFIVTENYQEHAFFNFISILLIALVTSYFLFLQINFYYIGLFIINSFLNFLLFANVNHFYSKIPKNMLPEHYYSYKFFYNKNKIVKPIMKGIQFKYIITLFSVSIIVINLFLFIIQFDFFILLVGLLLLVPFSFFIYSFITHTLNIIFSLSSPITAWFLPFFYKEKSIYYDVHKFKTSSGFNISFQNNLIHNEDYAAFRIDKVPEIEDRFFFKGLELKLTKEQKLNLNLKNNKLKDIFEKVNRLKNF